MDIVAKWLMIMKRKLANAGARLERSRLKYERLSKLITAMKAGIGHMQDKLEAVREELGGKKHDIGDETVSEVLRESELCPTNIIRRIRANDDDRKRAELTGNVGGAPASPSAQDKGTSEMDDINMARPYNHASILPDDDEGDLEDAGALIWTMKSLPGTKSRELPHKSYKPWIAESAELRMPMPRRPRRSVVVT